MPEKRVARLTLLKNWIMFFFKPDFLYTTVCFILLNSVYHKDILINYTARIISLYNSSLNFNKILVKKV